MTPKAIRCAVVGSGPAGLYAAQALLRRFPRARVDIFERLPVPFGLVRYGVSPDHSSTRNVTSQFSNLFEKYESRLFFHGNMNISDNTPLSDIYHHVIKATGASHARTLQLPNNNNNGSMLTAHDFIMWLNGHPQHVNDKRIPDLLKTTRHLVIIGTGNVAIDVARLFLYPVSYLDSFNDVCISSMERLKQLNQVRNIQIIGRRGAHDAKWTSAALREILTKIPLVHVETDHGSSLDNSIKIAQNNRKQSRMLNILKNHTYPLCSTTSTLSNNLKRLTLTFNHQLQSVSSIHQNLNLQFTNNNNIHNKDDINLIQTDSCITSLGYQSNHSHENSHQFPSAVGWAAGIARGVIADTKWDAETVVANLHDIDDDHVLLVNDNAKVSEWLNQWNNNKDDDVVQASSDLVDWQGWLRIHTEELRRGRLLRRNGHSVRIESIAEMLRIAAMG